MTFYRLPEIFILKLTYLVLQLVNVAGLTNLKEGEITMSIADIFSGLFYTIINAVGYVLTYPIPWQEVGVWLTILALPLLVWLWVLGIKGWWDDAKLWWEELES